MHVYNTPKLRHRAGSYSTFFHVAKYCRSLFTIIILLLGSCLLVCLLQATCMKLVNPLQMSKSFSRVLTRSSSPVNATKRIVSPISEQSTKARRITLTAAAHRLSLLLPGFAAIRFPFRPRRFPFSPDLPGGSNFKSTSRTQQIIPMFPVLVLSCLVSLECTLWEGFFWRMPKQAYTVPCRASHPHGQGAQVLCT